MGKLIINLIALEIVLSIYSACAVIFWNWAFTEKPLNFWVAFCAIHVIRFIGQQFRK